MRQKPGTFFRIDEDIRSAVRVKLAEEDVKLTAVLNDFLRAWVAGQKIAPQEPIVAKRQRTLVKHMEGIRDTEPAVADALELAIGTIYRRLSGTDTIASAIADGREVARRISRQMGGTSGRGTGTGADPDEDD